MSEKQDKVSPRTAAELERKYNLGGIANGTNSQISAQLSQLTQSLSQYMATTNAQIEEIFTRLEALEDSGRLPTGYTEVEYLESSGTQWIDTDFTPNQNSSMSITFQDTLGNTDSRTIAGAGTGNDSFAISTYLGGTAEYCAQQAFQVGNFGTDMTTVELRKNVLYKNNSVIYTFNTTAFTTQYSLTLFMFNLNGGTNTENGNGIRIFSAKVYDNDSLIRDFVPCINANNEVGMYDLVSQTFFANNGEGAFVSGSTV